MTLPKTLVLLAALLIAPFALAEEAPAPEKEAPSIARLLSADADLIAYVEDTAAFGDAWKVSSLSKLFAEPTVSNYLSPMLDALEFGEAGESFAEVFGTSPGELASLIDGFGISVHGLEETIVSEVDPKATMILATSQPEKLHEILSRQMPPGEDDEAEEEEPAGETEESPDDVIETRTETETEDFEGVTIESEFFIETLRSGDERRSLENEQAVFDGLYVISDVPGDLRGIIAAVRGGASRDAFTETSRFREGAQLLAPEGLVISVSGTALYDSFSEIMREDARANPSGTPPVNPDILLKSLAIDALEGLTLSLAPGAASIDLGVVVKLTEQRGIFRVLAYQPGPPEYPSFVPADCIEVASARFSFQEMWTEILATLEVAAPQVHGMMRAQLAGFSQGLGVDVEQGLIGSLEDRTLMMSFPLESEDPGEEAPLAELTQVGALALSDAQAFETTLNAVISVVDPTGQLFESQEFMGMTLRVLNAPAPEGGKQLRTSFAIAQDRLFFSNHGPEPVRRVLANLNSEAPSFWKREDVAAAIATLPPEASVHLFMRSSQLLDAFFRGLAMGWDESTGAAGTDAEGLPTFDAEKIPPSELVEKYLGVATGSLLKSEQGFVLKLRILPGQ